MVCQNLSALVIQLITDVLVVGCKFSDKCIYPETFDANPDSKDEIYSTEFGVYQPHCGLSNVMLSWGHDEVSSKQTLLLNVLDFH